MTKEKEQENKEVDKAKGIVVGSVNARESKKEDKIISGETRKEAVGRGYRDTFKTKKNKIFFVSIVLVAIILISIALGIKQTQQNTEMNNQDKEFNSFISDLEKQEKEYINDKEGYYGRLLEGYIAQENCKKTIKIYEQKISKANIKLTTIQTDWLAECYKADGNKEAYKNMLITQKQQLEKILSEVPNEEKQIINDEIANVEARIKNAE